MLTYQKLSSRTIPLSIAKLMTNSLGESFADGDRSNDESTPAKSSSIKDDFLRPSQIDDLDRPKVQNSLNTSTTILIVDDTPNNLQVLFSYLETAGFKVLLAEDGESALQIAQSQAPDLILLDVLMPEIDGFETCSRLKAQASTKDIPVIFLTALSETVNKIQGFKLGGVDYITKPTEQEEVLARIQTHLHLQKMRRTLAVQNHELQKSLDFEASVRRIADKIRDSLNEGSCLQIATKELTRVLDLGGCQVELYDLEQRSAKIAYEHLVSLPSCLGENRDISDFPQLYEQLLAKSSVQLSEAIPPFNCPEAQVTSIICPIFDDRGVIGNLWGFRPRGEVFTPWEVRLTQQIATQCAIAIRQARLYAESNRQIAELARLNQLKNDFLKTISHELKAPMSSIQLAAQTLEHLLKNTANPLQSPLFNRVLTIFHESCQRQKQLVDDLLTLCYVDAKAKIIKPEWFELNFWLSDLAQLYLERVQNQQQELIIDLYDQNLNLYADPIILERIVRELLNNACKYTPSESTITIQTQVVAGKLCLCIANTGVEISPAEQDLIFDQFYRIPNNDPWQYGGTGLGLTLVKKLSEIIGGSITVTSDRHSTIFCLQFPPGLIEIGIIQQ